MIASVRRWLNINTRGHYERHRRIDCVSEAIEKEMGEVKVASETEGMN